MSLTPLPKTVVQVSKRRAFQRSTSDSRCYHRPRRPRPFSSPSTFQLRTEFTALLRIIRFRECLSPGVLPPVQSFPLLRVLRDASDVHHEHHQTARFIISWRASHVHEDELEQDRLGGGYQYNQSRTLRYPGWRLDKSGYQHLPLN